MKEFGDSTRIVDYSKYTKEELLIILEMAQRYNWAAVKRAVVHELSFRDIFRNWEEIENEKFIN